MLVGGIAENEASEILAEGHEEFARLSDLLTELEIIYASVKDEERSRLEKEIVRTRTNLDICAFRMEVAARNC